MSPPSCRVLDQPAEGAHLAVLFSGSDEQWATLIPYLTGALVRGEGAVCVTSAEEQLRARVEADVVPTAQSYLKDGLFNPAFMLEWLGDLSAGAPAGGQGPRQCIAGVLDWVGDLDPGGLTELFRYESSLNLIAASSRHTFACYYDLRALRAEGVLTVLRTHPRVVVGGMPWESPFYEESALDPFAPCSPNLS
jgi:hypothetical protein